MTPRAKAEKVRKMIDQVSFANSHETSEEIVEAIVWLAQDNGDKAERIWQEPTDEEKLAIWQRATKNGSIDDEDLFWGESTLASIK